MEPETRMPEATHVSESAEARSGNAREAPRNAKARRRANAWLLSVAGALALLPWLCTTSPPRDFPGTDGEALRVVTELQPGYRPWIAPLFAPLDANVERLLFGLQAAFGVAIVAYCLALLRASRNQRRAHVTHD